MNPMGLLLLLGTCCFEVLTYDYLNFFVLLKLFAVMSGLIDKDIRRRCRTLNFFSGKENKAKEKRIEERLLENYDQYDRLAYSYVHNDADAGDIVQNGAYRAIKNSSTLKRNEYAATRVYRIMLNEIFRFCENEKGKAVSLDEVQTEEGKEDVYKDFDLYSALDSLSKEDKAVVELRYFEDKKLEEIARIMDENVNTIKSRLYRSMKKLRAKLDSEERTSQ